MYNNKNVKTFVSIDYDEVPKNFDPNEFFDKKIEFLNEKYREAAFEKTKVLLAIYPVNKNINIGIISCRNLSCIHENKIIMCMFLEEHAKKVINKVQKMVNTCEQATEEQILTSFSLLIENDDKHEDDNTNYINTYISPDIQNDFTEDGLENFISHVVSDCKSKIVNSKNSVNEVQLIAYTIKNKKYGVIVEHKNKLISQIILNTFSEAVNDYRNFEEYSKNRFQITINNFCDFSERSGLKKKLRKKKIDNRRRRRR